MPIILPEGLACTPLLLSEGIDVLHSPPRRASTLRVGLVNLMPDMATTERQFARLLGATHQDVELVLALPRSCRPQYQGTALYERWDGASLPNSLDGLIVTGAPLEHLPFEDVTYWRELASICDWAASSATSTLYICWAAFAALYAFHGVRTRMLPQKISGIFPQQIMDRRDPMTTGLGATFPCPVSRHAEVEARNVPWKRGLTLLAQSSESGLCLVADTPKRAYYMFNHLEYDADTLKLEYLRDRARRADTALPQNYLPDGDVTGIPPLVWRQPAQKVFANWLALLAARRRGQEKAGGLAQAPLPADFGVAMPHGQPDLDLGRSSPRNHQP